MCTSLAMNMKIKENPAASAFYFGRNMDLEYHFDERVVIAPRNFPLSFQYQAPIGRHYAMMGMATVAEGFPLYAEAFNETGLCIAGLNFPGYAQYAAQPQRGKLNLAPFELIPWLLSSCSDLEEASAVLERLQLVNTDFNERIPSTPLHWHIA